MADRIRRIEIDTVTGNVNVFTPGVSYCWSGGKWLGNTPPHDVQAQIDALWKNRPGHVPARRKAPAKK